MSMNDDLSANNDQGDDPTPTQKVYTPIYELQTQHDQAMDDMLAGYRSGNTDQIANAFIRIMRLEPQMRQAGVVARQYFLSKVMKNV